MNNSLLNLKKNVEFNSNLTGCPVFSLAKPGQPFPREQEGQRLSDESPKELLRGLDEGSLRVISVRWSLSHLQNSKELPRHTGPLWVYLETWRGQR